MRYTLHCQIFILYCLYCVALLQAIGWGRQTVILSLIYQGYTDEVGFRDITLPPIADSAGVGLISSKDPRINLEQWKSFMPLALILVRKVSNGTELRDYSCWLLPEL